MTRERVDRPDHAGRYRNPYVDPMTIDSITIVGGGRADLADGLGFDPGASGSVYVSGPGPGALGSMADLAHEIRNMPPVKMPTPDPEAIAAAGRRFRETIDQLIYPTRRKP